MTVRARERRDLFGSNSLRAMEETALSIARAVQGLPFSDVSCPACAETAYESRVVRNGFRIVECSSCDSLYVRARPPEERLQEIYDQFPQLAGGREGQATDDPEDGLWEAEYRLSRLLTFASSGRLLDFGCGRGDFILAARRFFDVQGVDIAPRMRPQARSLPVFQGRLEDAGFPDGSFDVVTAVEVLEHLYDPQRTLREIHRIMKTQGILLLQTGDADSFRAHLNLDTWTYLQPPIHLNVYSRRGLTAIANRLGFEQVKSWSFGRAPLRIPVLAGLWKSKALRLVLDWAAWTGLIGSMCIWRKAK